MKLNKLHKILLGGIGIEIGVIAIQNNSKLLMNGLTLWGYTPAWFPLLIICIPLTDVIIKVITNKKNTNTTNTDISSMIKEFKDND